MAVNVQFVKVAPDLLRCLTPSDKEAISHVAIGQCLNSEFKKTRNYEFHKRFFALLKTGFDAWEPDSFTVEGVEIMPRKDFEAFREWITIKCGFFDVIGNPDGSVKVQAKSIAFGNMHQTEFEKLYDQAINVILWKVLPNTWSEQDFQDGITRNERRILEFAA